MSQKLITVFGATGNQGGSVVSALLNQPSLESKYKIRAITRDPSKPSAQALASKGVELTKADLNNKDSVKEAIAGSYGVFAVTNYWETTSKDVEGQQGHNIVDACKEEGIKHLVWSCLPNVSALTNGELAHVEHFDSKAAVGTYAESVKKSAGMAVSFFMPAFFMSNLPKSFKSNKDTGVPTLSQPWYATKTHLPVIDIQTDTGLYVTGLFEAGPSAADGASVQGVSQWTTPQEVVEIISKATNHEVKFEETPIDVKATLDMDRIPRELTQNMLLIRDYSYFGKGTENEQEESNKFFLKGAKPVTLEEFAKTAKWDW